MRDGSISTPAQLQSAIEGIVTQARWDGLSSATIAAILAAQAEVQKHK